MNFDNLPARANLFDASALVKIFAQEGDSVLIREFFFAHAPTRYTTPFCFYEALNLLKSKWLYRNELTAEDYREKAFRLTAWYSAATRYAKDIDLTDPIVFARVRGLAQEHSMDISDAFQIESMRSGYFSCLINGSATLLVTADRKLSEVARAEGLKAWYFPSEPVPR